MFKNQTFPNSVKTAVFGLKSAFKEERNFRIQFLIGVVVVFFMIAFNLNAVESSIIILMILVVLSLELVNSQIEKFLDIVHPDHHPRVKIIKDFSAGAVLFSVIGSVAIGVLIFLPHILNYLK
jgi:diacylglycerol kinase